MRKQKGFTLAEILITLGVIGVVAAATLPTLIGNHEKKVWAKSLEKAYSTAAQACQMALAREATTDVRYTDFWQSINNWTFADSHEAVGARYFKNAKITVISSDFTALNNPRIESLSGQDYVYTYWNWRYAVHLPGTTLYISANDSPSTALEFGVDVNGAGNDPNKAGADIFLFTLKFNCGYSKREAASACHNHYPTWSNMAGCFERIMQDGWEMKYDPILGTGTGGDY